MEAQALKLMDKVIELEVALRNKNETIDKHLKRIRLLNEKNPSCVYHQDSCGNEAWFCKRI
jgi:hypothetical protein